MAFTSLKSVTSRAKADLKAVSDLPKTAYVAVTDFWHKMVYVPAQSVIELTEAEVKYLKHAVVAVEDKVKAVEATVAKPVEAVKAVVEKATAATPTKDQPASEAAKS